MPNVTIFSGISITMRFAHTRPGLSIKACYASDLFPMCISIGVGT